MTDEELDTIAEGGSTDLMDRGCESIMYILQDLGLEWDEDSKDFDKHVQKWEKASEILQGEIKEAIKRLAKRIKEEL